MKQTKSIFLLRDMESGELDAILETEIQGKELEDLIQNIRFRRGLSPPKLLEYLEQTYNINVLCDYTRCHDKNIDIYY